MLDTVPAQNCIQELSGHHKRCSRNDPIPAYLERPKPLIPKTKSKRSRYQPITPAIPSANRAVRDGPDQCMISMSSSQRSHANVRVFHRCSVVALKAPRLQNQKASSFLAVQFKPMLPFPCRSGVCHRCLLFKIRCLMKLGRP